MTDYATEDTPLEPDGEAGIAKAIDAWIGRGGLVTKRTLWRTMRALVRSDRDARGWGCGKRVCQYRHASVCLGPGVACPACDEIAHADALAAALRDARRCGHTGRGVESCVDRSCRALAGHDARRG